MLQCVTRRIARPSQVGRTAAYVLGLALGFVTVPGALPTAEAQSKQELAKARERFREALALEEAENYSKALQAFKEVAAVKSTPQVRYHIGLCEEKTGDLVQALGSYKLALDEARAKKAKDVLEVTEAAIEELEPRIPQLTISRGQGAGVAKITLDGVEIGEAEIEVARPINPGPHLIEAESSGYRDYRKEFKLAESDERTVTVRLTKLESDTPVGPDPDPEPESSEGSALVPAGFVVGGVGVVSLALSGVFLGMRGGAISDLEESCGADHQSCPPEAQDTIDSGETYATLSSVTFVAGIGLLGAGIVMIAVGSGGDDSPAGADDQAGVSLTPTFDTSSMGLSLHGRM